MLEQIASALMNVQIDVWVSDKYPLLQAHFAGTKYWADAVGWLSSKEPKYNIDDHLNDGDDDDYDYRHALLVEAFKLYLTSRLYLQRYNTNHRHLPSSNGVALVIWTKHTWLISFSWFLTQMAGWLC